jgi:hypothetical protein
MTDAALIFTKLMFTSELFVKNSYTEFHENQLNNLTADSRSQSVHIRHFFSYLMKTAPRHKSNRHRIQNTKRQKFKYEQTEVM